MKLKNVLFILPLFLLLLLPSDVFADSYAFWKVPYKNTNYNTYDSFYGYYGSRATDLSGSTNYTTTFYYTGASFTSNTFDYVEIPFTIYIDGETDNITEATFSTIPNADTLYYVYNNVMLSIAVTYSNGNYENHADCEIIPSMYTGYSITGVTKCPVGRVADGIKQVTLKHVFENISSGQRYNIFFGSTGWINLIYKNDNGSGSISSAISSQTTNITNAQNQTTNAVNNNTTAINNLDSDITSSSTNSDSDNQSILTNMNNKLASNSTVSSLIVMPLTLYQSVLNSVNGSCTTFTLGSLFGTNVTFPCISPSDYLGSTLWGVIDVLISGFFIFYISKTMVNVFNTFTSMKDSKDIVGGGN